MRLEQHQPWAVRMVRPTAIYVYYEERKTFLGASQGVPEDESTIESRLYALSNQPPVLCHGSTQSIRFWSSVIDVTQGNRVWTTRSINDSIVRGRLSRILVMAYKLKGAVEYKPSHRYLCESSKGTDVWLRKGSCYERWLNLLRILEIWLSFNGVTKMWTICFTRPNPNTLREQSPKFSYSLLQYLTVFHWTGLTITNCCRTYHSKSHYRTSPSTGP